MEQYLIGTEKWITEKDAMVDEDKRMGK